MRLLFAYLALAGVTLGSPRPSAIASVWAIGDGDKVTHEGGVHPLPARNAVWDGRVVHLFAARNEVLAFQLIVEAGTAGIAALDATLPELRERGGDARIVYAPPDADPTRYAGRPISLFTVRDMLVSRETSARWAWRPGSPATPSVTVGWQPVQLIPENARPGRGGLPASVAARRRQVLWFEIYTGRDHPAGVYEGTIAVRADAEVRSVPVQLTLLDFALPDENSLDAMVYYESAQPTQYHGRPMDAAYHRFAHRQRVEFVHAYNEVMVRRSLGRFTGGDFTGAAGYEGPGEATGNRIVPLSFYGAGRSFQTREGSWRRSDEWMRFVADSLPGARTFVYLADEPSPEQYDEVRQLADRIRSNPGPGRALPTFITKPIVPDLDGSVDTWCIPPQAFDIAAAAAEQAKGRRTCFYNGGRPNGPALVIDAPATEARVVAWAAFKHQVGLYFYWHATHWRHNSQIQGARDQDVWANPVTFDNRGQPGKPIEDQGFLNGDGVLVYPGEERVHSMEDRDIAGPISTVQMANLRRGLQDHQYLTLARRLGLDSAVRDALRMVVPQVFSDAGTTVGFAESGETFEAARRLLAEAITTALADRDGR